MATFDEHINQAKKNLTFLTSVNHSIDNSWDWQVTVSFYVSVHLMNAHIAKKIDQHYRSHEDVNNALNPFVEVSLTKLDEDTYKSYIKLQGLARRARYLCHDNPKVRETTVCFTYDKHFSKAIKNLDKLVTFITSEYGVEFNATPIHCLELENYQSEYFQINNTAKI